jgi:hypothetical protein
MIGTLTSSRNNSAHTSSFTKTIYKKCTVAIFEDPGHLSPINYVCVVAFASDLQRASFYGMTVFLPYSTTIKHLPLHNTHKRSHQALESRYDASWCNLFVRHMAVRRLGEQANLSPAALRSPLNLAIPPVNQLNSLEQPNVHDLDAIALLKRRRSIHVLSCSLYFQNFCTFALLRLPGPW